MSLLEIKGLTKAFGGLVAVKDLDLFVNKGEIVGLIGPNGAGKTTLFSMISGFLPPTRGKIIFKGENIVGLKPYEVARRGLVRTFQLTTLFGRATVLENVIAGFYLNTKAGVWSSIFYSSSARSQIREVYQKAMELLEFMGLTEVKDSQAGKLPHGHQRSLGVAIALATNAELILFDEPVTGMTATETRDMMSRLRAIRERGTTIVIVEHDMKAIMGIADRIYAINFGAKIAEGSPKEISNNKEVIKAYLGRGTYAS